MGTKVENDKLVAPAEVDLPAANGHMDDDDMPDMIVPERNGASGNGHIDFDPQLNRNGQDGAVPPGGVTGFGNKPAPEDSRLKVIKFSKVSKRFVLHTERSNSFQEMVTGLLGRGKAFKTPPPELAPAAKDFWALRDVNFSVYAGESLGIIGENGSGKSTTLKLISRILYPTDGSVSVKGKVSALLELGTGFHTDLTGRENIYLNGSLLGINRRDMQDRYNDIVAFSELERFIDTPIKFWSSGMVMRLGFAVAISVDPDILITDEVLAVGDEAFQRKCMEQIAKLRRAGKTIIFVSHALEAVRNLCSRAIWLEHGVLRADGNASQVIDQYLDYANKRHRERLQAEYAAEHQPTAAAGHTDTDLAADIRVDVDEADGVAEAEDTTPPHLRPRWGNGQAEVREVIFLDKDGTPSNVFTTGDSITIRIFYKAPNRIDHPVFGLAIYAAGGQHLTGPNSRFGGYDKPFIQGEGFVDYTMPSVPLMAGVYDITVALTNHDMTEMLDHQHRGYSFVIAPNTDLPDRFGAIYIPGQWH